MKKLLFGLLFIVASLGVAVIVAPNFVDWNKYRDEITAQVKSATGRDMEIRGDIRLAIIPSPALVVKDVHLANIEGAANADMASLESLEVHVALAPLLSRNLQVTSIKLVKPVINIEKLSEDRNNYTFSLGDKKAGNGQGKPALPFQPPAASPGAPGIAPDIAGFAVRIDSFVVENGTVNFRDTPAGSAEKIENLNGRFRMASLTGPMDAEGSAVVRGIPLSISLALGQIVQNRTLPLRVAVSVIPGDVKTRFNGSISGIGEKPRLKGKLAIDGANLGAFVAGISDGAALPDILAKPFSVLADIAATEKLAEVTGISVKLDGSQGTGRLSAEIGDSIDIDLGLAVNRLDLDKLLALPSATTAAENPSAAKKGTGESGGSASLALGARPSPPKGPAKPFSLDDIPANFSAALNLSVEAMTYRGDAIRQAKFNASLANREITLSQVSALLPGNSDVALFGFVSQKGKQPQFDGTVDFSTNDLRGMLKWAGTEVTGIARDHLRKLSIAAKLKATPDTLSISELKSQADNTKITGAATVALRARPSIGATILVDRINLNPYLPTTASTAGPKANQTSNGTKSASGSPESAATGGSSAQNPLAVLGVLGGIDFNLNARLNTLIFKDVRVSTVKVNSSLIDGNLNFKEWSVRDLAGVSAKIKGGVTGLKSNGRPADPAFKNFNISLRGKSLAKVFKLTGVKPPVSPAKLGPVSISTTLNGKPSALQLASVLNATGGTFSMDGVAKPLDGLPGFQGRTRIAHKDLDKVLKLFGVKYRPASGKLGGIDLSGNVTATPLGLALSSMNGQVAGVKLAGDTGIQWAALRPALTANIKTGTLDINRFLPKKSGTTTSSRRAPSKRTSTSRNRKSSTAKQGRWSNEPIDLSGLTSFDANIGLSSPLVIFDKFKVDNLILSSVLKNGILDIRRLTGKMFGGEMKMDGKVIAAPGSGQYQSRFSISRVNIPTALAAFGNRTLKSGTMEMVGDFRTGGLSQADLISSLTGNGSISLNNIDVSAGAARGTSFSGVTGLLSSVYGFARKLGGKTGRDVADLRGNFRVDKGIASFNDLTLASAIGTGSAKGVVDLPNWQLNVSGDLKLTDNLVLQLITKQSGPRLIPFRVSGLMDKPNVKLDTSGFTRGGIVIPGAIGKKIEKLTKKKGVGRILEQIFPGAQPSSQSAPSSSSTSSSSGAPPPQQPSPQPAPRITRPEDVLKGILQGLTR